jgi:energy-coupling factor transporter ATP-binding protein EcfA2
VDLAVGGVGQVDIGGGGNNKLDSDSDIVGNRMIIMRGYPGSGKSTLAKSLGGVVFSTDVFFTDPQSGAYRFDAALLGKAHKWNEARVKAAVQSGEPTVVVDNTHCQLWEMQEYVRIGVDAGYLVTFRTPNTPWRNSPTDLAMRTIHGVPAEKIAAMMSKFEPDATVDNVLAAVLPAWLATSAPPPGRQSQSTPATHPGYTGAVGTTSSSLRAKSVGPQTQAYPGGDNVGASGSRVGAATQSPAPLGGPAAGHANAAAPQLRPSNSEVSTGGGSGVTISTGYFTPYVSSSSSGGQPAVQHQQPGQPQARQHGRPFDPRFLQVVLPPPPAVTNVAGGPLASGALGGYHHGPQAHLATPPQQQQQQQQQQRPTRNRVRRRSGRFLLVLDLNGFMIDRRQPKSVRSLAGGRVREHDFATVTGTLVFVRPGLHAFVAWLLERFDVGIWSSATAKNLHPILNQLFGPATLQQFRFVMDQADCVINGMVPSSSGGQKKAFIKELKDVWKKVGEGPAVDMLTTLLLDDSEYKVARNPVNTAIHPPVYTAECVNDNVLMPGGAMRLCLERLLEADNVPTFVEQQGTPYLRGPFEDPSRAAHEFDSRAGQQHSSSGGGGGGGSAPPPSTAIYNHHHGNSGGQYPSAARAAAPYGDNVNLGELYGSSEMVSAKTAGGAGNLPLDRSRTPSANGASHVAERVGISKSNLVLPPQQQHYQQQAVGRSLSAGSTLSNHGGTTGLWSPEPSGNPRYRTNIGSHSRSSLAADYRPQPLSGGGGGGGGASGKSASWDMHSTGYGGGGFGAPRAGHIVGSGIARPHNSGGGAGLQQGLRGRPGLHQQYSQQPQLYHNLTHSGAGAGRGGGNRDAYVNARPPHMNAIGYPSGPIFTSRRNY